jgi:peroxiredoxin
MGKVESGLHLDNVGGRIRFAGVSGKALSNVTVVGVSTDSVESHRRFADKYHLTFDLLSDPDHVAFVASAILVAAKSRYEWCMNKSTQ